MNRIIKWHCSADGQSRLKKQRLPHNLTNSVSVRMTNTTDRSQSDSELYISLTGLFIQEQFFMRVLVVAHQGCVFMNALLPETGNLYLAVLVLVTLKRPPLVRAAVAKHSFSHSAPYLWNSRPSAMRTPGPSVDWSQQDTGTLTPLLPFGTQNSFLIVTTRPVPGPFILLAVLLTKPKPNDKLIFKLVCPSISSAQFNSYQREWG